MRLPKPCTAISISPTGEYFATAQEGDVGVNIWTNRTLFTHVSTRHISDADIATITAPTTSGEGGHGLIEAAAEELEEDEELDETAVPIIDQLNERITTLSLVPKARWQTLLHLDIIHARNKPREAPKPPEKAPFFLGALSQNQSTGSTLDTLANSITEPTSRVSSSALASRSSAASATNEFTRHLADAAESADYTHLLAHLSSLPPSAADIAIRTMDTMEPYTELYTFVQALTARLQERRDYELVQTWMSVFLRLHGDVIVGEEGLVKELRKWQEEAKRERERVGGLVGYSVGVVGWVRSSR